MTPRTPERGRIRSGSSDVDAVGNAPEAGALERLPRQPDGAGERGLKRLPIECLRRDTFSHRVTLPPSDARSR